MSRDSFQRFIETGQHLNDREIYDHHIYEVEKYEKKLPSRYRRLIPPQNSSSSCSIQVNFNADQSQPESLTNTANRLDNLF